MLKRINVSGRIKIILLIPVLILLCGLIFYLSIYFGAWGSIPGTDELKELKQAQSTQLLDKDEKLIGKYYIFDRQPVKFEDFPRYLINALIATEDARFYEHKGVDNRSIARVFLKTILLGDKSSGGGSTITTQLAKNLFGRNNYGVFSILVNKVKEAIIAKRLEEIYSKEEIITLYLNTVPFSDNTYGIESASQKFFSKHVSNLTLAEAATLIGTLKASHSYNPRLFPERSQLRRDVVIKQMVKYDYLSEEEANECINEKLEINYQFFNHDDGLAPYFREHIKQELKIILKELKKEDGSEYDIYKDGLKVFTTLDSKLQEYAEEAMKENMLKLQAEFEKSYGKNAPWLKKGNITSDVLKKSLKYQQLKAAGLSDKEIKDSLSKKVEMEVFSWNGNLMKNLSPVDSLKYYLKFLNTGLISIEPQTGAVRAYIGGINYKNFKYDHVSQSKRQVGSTFKPIVYTAAIENGMDPCTYFSAREITYTDMENWTPENATNEDEESDEHINYSLKYALSNSVNTVAVKVLDHVGIDSVIAQAKRMGITDELPQVPSLALGVAEIQLKDIAGAYASYVNSGKPVKPYYIEKIEDKNGNVLFNFEPEAEKKPAFSDKTRFVMLEMMKATVDSGTAKRLRKFYKLPNDIAGKTGTTQNNKDGWFVGLTPKLVTVTWVGNDDHRIGFKTTAMGQGANTALPIFASLYQKINAHEEFNYITAARFEKADNNILESLQCESIKRDGFFKRLFGKKKKEKEFGEKKKGIFSFLKKKDK
ncbi:penicillin-binding protein 1A [Abyssalbus ytuae]|uniref:PBP1A family penicillin-binding protein n=1 Tax=Abyssalbus ytuae TaxID=2926907 RepID=A0A9E6ZNJ3_9FLAO|nr:PBP1A family penicillin-binding protein [Abyssalbus ytuae]UOB17610.1 PBP1A family penicillin-binding protein [Abyssalbus ytuae]